MQIPDPLAFTDIDLVRDYLLALQCAGEPFLSEANHLYCELVETIRLSGVESPWNQSLTALIAVRALYGELLHKSFLLDGNAFGHALGNPPAFA